MREQFLHFIWQYQYFEKEALTTTNGEQINIIQPGFGNTDAGPDFKNARIIIDGLEWNGHVEIHVNASEWIKHGHESDPGYKNVILHVVWKNDQTILYPDGNPIPTLELQNRISADLYQRSFQLLENKDTIPCTPHFHSVSELTRLVMLERAMLDRLEQKATEVNMVLEANGGDWEETTYQWLAKNMGFKVNSDPFFSLAQRIPAKIIGKHRSQLLQIEALLFGMAGLLDHPSNDTYEQSLKKEFEFLAHKYDLAAKKMNAVEWRFLRLRPANFPTLRIAQFAALLHKQGQLFSFFTSFDDPKAFIQNFEVAPSDYWQSHYRFGTKAKRSIAPMGKSSVENILINTVAPILAAYGKLNDNSERVEKALALLANLPPEKNHIIDRWKSLGASFSSAFDSQGYLSLYKHYCQPRKCLQCGIGVSLFRQP